MDTYQMGLLIRALMFLAMIFVLIIAGVFLARREKHLASHSESDGLTNSGQQPAVMQDSLRYPANRGRLEANESEASAPGVQRRAA